jgi:hypothetical protein
MNGISKALAIVGIPLACWIGWNLYEENREVPSKIRVTDTFRSCEFDALGDARGNIYFARTKNMRESLFVVKDDLFEHMFKHRDGDRQKSDFHFFLTNGKDKVVSLEGEWISSDRTLLPGLRFKIDEHSASGRTMVDAFESAQSLLVESGDELLSWPMFTPYEIGQFSACVKRMRK